jgi:iduronate 2-sulfatase
MLGQPARNLTPEAIREIRHGYLANISYFDAQLGKVLDELERQGLAENTVIVFWSDHGYHLGEQTLWAKTSNFELDARVPFLISAPGMANGSRTESLAELLDIYPTLVDLCGLPAAIGVEGTSLVPVLKTPTTSVKQFALTQHPRPAYYDRDSANPTTMGYSLRTDRHRYTEWRDWKTGATEARELYDHQTDPDETKNIADDPQNAATVQASAKLLNGLKPHVQPR